MPSTGIDRRTGKLLRGWPHVLQSIEVIFTTHIGERVMRRTFGSNVPAILGRENIVTSAIARFFAAIVVAIELWEPRFRVIRIIFPPDENTPDANRTGRIGMRIVGQYRPNALQGDFTVESVKDFVL